MTSEDHRKAYIETLIAEALDCRATPFIRALVDADPEVLRQCAHESNDRGRPTEKLEALHYTAAAGFSGVFEKVYKADFVSLDGAPGVWVAIDHAYFSNAQYLDKNRRGECDGVQALLDGEGGWTVEGEGTYLPGIWMVRYEVTKVEIAARAYWTARELYRRAP